MQASVRHEVVKMALPVSDADFLAQWTEVTKNVCSRADASNEGLRDNMIFLITTYADYGLYLEDVRTLERAAKIIRDHAKQYGADRLSAGLLVNMATLVALLEVYKSHAKVPQQSEGKAAYDLAGDHVQSLVKQVVDTSLRHADSSKRPDFRELEGYRMDHSETANPRWNTVCSYVAESVNKFGSHLPYGKEGTAAYRYMQEMRFYMKGHDKPGPLWPRILREALTAPADKKRVAELVLGQANKEHPLLSILEKDERDFFLRHAAEGVSAKDVWSLLKRDDLVELSKNQSGRREGGRHRLRFEHDMEGGDDIVGRWESKGKLREGEDCTIFKFKPDPSATRALGGGGPGGGRGGRGGPMAMLGNLMGGDDDDMFDDGFPMGMGGGMGGRGPMRSASYHLELMLPGHTKPIVATVQQVPQQRTYAQAVVADYYCEFQGKVLLFLMKSRGFMHRERTARMSVYVKEARGGPVAYELYGPPNYLLAKDEVSEERVVVFAARALREVLQNPTDSAERLKEHLQKAYKDLEGLQEQLQTYIARVGVRRCHPATLLHVLESMEPKSKIFGETGWLVSQAEHAPCINLIAVIGLAMEAGHLLNRYPVAVAGALEAVAKGETNKGRDPLSVLQSLNKVSCHDFDGTWTWVNGLHGKTHPDAFTISGHHVRLNSPHLHSCTLREIKYEDDGLRFVLVQDSVYVETTQGVEEEHSREQLYTVELRRTGSGYTGRYMKDTTHRWTQCRFELTAPPAERPVCEWGEQSNKGTFPQLAERISAWACESLHKEADACTTIRTIFPSLQVGQDDPFYGPILRLWEACCKQIVKKTSTEKLLPTLDNWVLAVQPGKSLADLRDLRMHAAKILLKAYSTQRPVRWNSVPVSLVKLKQLKGNYATLGTFIDSVSRENNLLQSNLNNRKISARSFMMMRNYRAIYNDNNLKTPADLKEESFRNPKKDLETTQHLCRELMEQWGVREDSRRMQDMEQKIRESDLVDLCDLESTVEEGKRTLGPAWEIQDAVLSPLLRAHFRHSSEKGKVVTLGDMPRIFEQLKKNLRKFTLRTTVGEATAFMDPKEGRLQGERKKQEVDLLTKLGVSREVADALVDGALPLRFMIDGLKSFRTLASDECPKDLRLQPDFFNKRERELLLESDLNNTPLSDALGKCNEIREVSGGCKHEVLEVIATMLKCEKIVEFTRDHPHAQDEGLANVLTNARDLQHASFQTFLNCVTFINPFVSASKLHMDNFAERTRELQQEWEDQGLKAKVTIADVASAASLRAPINNRTTTGAQSPDGFWDLLSRNFANDVNVRQIQANLERINTAEQVDGLEKMIKEQNGATDRLISHCRAAAGLPPAENDDVEPEAMNVNQEPSLVVIELPPTGVPSLTCEFGGVTKSGPEYQDIVYRATLQWNLDEALDTFRVQAREVLRAFNTTCVLFGEGHIEFRSRKISFRHNEGGVVNQMLRTLVGQWSADTAGLVSVFHEACDRHPSLACLTPAELVRMAELMRGVSSTGDLTKEEAGRMVMPWRETRSRPTRRGQQVSAVMNETQETANQQVQEMCPQMTPCLAVRLPQRTPLPEDPNPLKLMGCGEADGEYRRGLYTYARVDGATLVPVSNGWAVYSKAAFDGHQLLASCSEHDGSLEPWAMDGWVEPDQYGLLSNTPSAVRVQIDGAHAVHRNWSSDTRPLLQQVRVQAPDGTKVPVLEVSESPTGRSLFIGAVDLYSFWGALGFERGMKLTSVTTAEGDELKGNKEIMEFFKNSGSSGGAKKNVKDGFIVEVQSPWVWGAASAPSQMDISANGRSITKMRGLAPSIAFSGAPGIACTWRILLEGDVQGARVGLCRPNIDFKSSEADGERNKGLAFWYLRGGVLRHNGRDVSLTKPFKSGDVITVSHSRKQKRISFKLNDVELGAMFTEVDVSDLRPCVYLKERAATATLCNGAPITEVLTWNEDRIDTKDIKITNNGKTVSKKSTATIAGAIGSTVFRGPGPHKFQVGLKAREKTDKVYIGLAPPGVDLKEKVKEGHSFFGMTILDNGSVYNLQEPGTVAATGKVAKEAGVRPLDQLVIYQFTVDLGEGTVDVIRNGERLVHTATLQDFPRAEGPLVPYVLFDGTAEATEVTLQAEEASAVNGSPAVVIRGTRDPKLPPMRAGAKGVPPVGPADGLYERGVPTYVRKDNKYQLFHWNGRWCVSDPVDRPVAFSSATDGNVELGTRSLKWTTVRGFSSVPQVIRIVTPVQPGGLMKLQTTQQGGKVWYANSTHALFWSKAVRRWVVTDIGCANDTSGAVKAYYSSSNPEELPHCCTSWHWGSGSSWSSDTRIRVAAFQSESMLRQDSRGLCWTKAEFGTGWDAAAEVDHRVPKLMPMVNIETHIHSVSATELDADMMTADELAGCHIINKACDIWVKGPDLRRALVAAAKGSDSGIELRVDWASAAEAQTAVRESALVQLQRIGQLLFEVKGAAVDPRSVNNYDKKVARYGVMVGHTVEGAIVDTSRIPMADRKLFGLSLFEGDVRPYHVLDCTESTLEEDATAFVTLFRHLKTGRMVVLNLQALNSESRNLVRACIEGNESKDKEMLAIVTGGDGTDETIESVDSMCDMRWKKWALQRAMTLNKFKSITYYAQEAGMGKTFAIEFETAKGTWGKGVTPTRLDLDSTTESLCEVCRRLMGPLRRQEGLLYVHIGHDTEPGLVNQVLDSLIFFGRIQSNSGLSASLPPKGWHLVVELQRPPEKEVGHDVNPPWIRSDGSSDITILACQGIAERGKLYPYNSSHHHDAPAMLKFLREYIPPLKRIEDDVLVRMLALGLNKAPEQDSEEYAAFKESLEPLSARFITRALKYAIKKFRKFQPTDKDRPRNLSGTSSCLVIAEGIIHEMGHFVTPTRPDHYHVICDPGDVKKYTDHMLLSGKLPPDMATALGKMWQDIERNLRAMSRDGVMIPTMEKSSRDAPFHRLLEMLCDELMVDTKLAVGCLRDKSYVLIPDFLQKLIQLSTHIDLNDPAILQGPSGTGKSYAIMILSELLHLPTRPSAHLKREGFRDLQSAINVFLRINKPLKQMFPDNESDVRINGKAVVWGAEHVKPYQNVLDCLDRLVERKNKDGLNYVREGLLECVGPCIKDEMSFPDVAKVINDDKKPSLKKSANLLFDANADIAALRAAIEELTRELSRVSGGFLSLEMVQQMESRLSSERMRELAGSVHDDFVKILARRHKYEAMQAWARSAVPMLKGKADRLCRLVKEMVREEVSKSPILSVPPDLLAELADTGGRTDTKALGEALGNTLARVVDLKRESTTLFILMRYDMTTDMLYEQMLPSLLRAVQCPNIRFMIMIDEMNATKMLGLVKRIVVDRYWSKWEDEYPPLQGRIPENIAFVGAVNPSKKDASLEGVADMAAGEKTNSGAAGALGFDVTPMPPSLMHHVVPWKQLAEGQRDMFVMRLIKQSRNLFSADIRPNQIVALSKLLLDAHKFAQIKMQEKRSTVSQRDIHRTMKLFDYFFKQGLDFTLDGKSTEDVWNRSLSAMLMGIAVSYYFRFGPDDRAQLSTKLTEKLEQLAVESKDPAHVPVEGDRGNIKPMAQEVTFAAIVKKAVSHFCHKDHLHLPEAVYAHQGLMENLFVQMVCFHIRLAVILEGAPGTSKTLSNNIIRDNMTGTGNFWQDFCHISHICRYQGSAQSSAEEIKKKCEEAHQKQTENDEAGAKNKRALLFVDEAGLVRGEGDGHKWALKVLHYYLEGANLASVLMTNATLDPAIGNRCIVVYMAEPEPQELTNMCAGILHNQGMAGLSPEGQKVIPVLCNAFHTLVPPPKLDKDGKEIPGYDGHAECRWWYGLRDLFHLMRYIRRNQEMAGRLVGDTNINLNPLVVARALQRNMNGPHEYFDKVLRVYGAALEAAAGAQYSAAALKTLLRPNLETILDSIADNNRATDGASGKNLNDMWVRFKLIVDTTDDGSMLQLLKQMEIPSFKDISVLSLSALSQGDKLMPVTVVSQIVAAMETGKTVWLTNTREIDACLFDVFNQNYVVSCSGNNEVNHFVPIAIGAALEYKQVHRNFQCIVHVTKKELGGMGDVLPSPFLNRLEKFTLSVEDIVQYRMHDERMYPDQAAELRELRQKAEQLESSLSLARGCALFTASAKETIGSLMLEAIDGMKLQPVVISRRITSDEALQHFIFGANKKQARWRKMACKMLQVCQLDHMLLGQRVLKEYAAAYLRAYFRDLAPWSLSGYMADLQMQVSAKTAEKLWLKSVVYSPANVDFPSILDKLPGVRHRSIDHLMDSERGQDDLHDALYHFCLDPSAKVFVMVIGPDVLGSPAAREVRLMLDSTPELKEKEKEQLTNKAVVVLQAYQSLSMTGANACTPLFGTGWDQLCIDVSGEHLGVNMIEYVEPAVIGRLPSQEPPEWKDIEPMVDTAMHSLMGAQIEASKKWAQLEVGDPAAAVYDMKCALGEQVEVAHKLLGCCRYLRRALVRLYKERIPSHMELVEMARDVAAQEKAQSLPHRLVEEKEKAPVALLMFALRFLMDDRNASALLYLQQKAGGEALLEQSDQIIAKALEIAAGETTFHHLRHLKVTTMPTLNVRATKPSLPGSSCLMDSLPVPAAAVDARAEAVALREKHGGTIVGSLVELVHQNQDTVLAFFEDCIRARVKYNEANVVRQVVPCVFQLARGLHAEVFGKKEPETVWSVRSLCCVEAAAIDDFVLAMVPLAAMDVLTASAVDKFVVKSTSVKGSWVSHELGPLLLLESFKTAKDKEELAHFCTACASMLRRATREAYAESRCLPALGVIAGLLKEKDSSPALVAAAVSLNLACQAVKAPLALDMGKLASVLDKFPATTPRVVLELAKLHQQTGEKHTGTLVPFILERIAGRKIERAMCARIVQLLLPAPKESLRTEMPAMLMVAAAPRGVKAAQAAEAKFHPPCSTPDGKRPGKLSKNIAVHESPVYVALYDVYYDMLVGIGGELINVSGWEGVARIWKDLKVAPAGEDVGVALARKVLLRVSEIAFLQYLACAFQRPVGEATAWQPTLMENEAKVALVSEVARELTQPKGLKCPAYHSSENLKLSQQWPDPDCEYNAMVLIHTMEAGVGVFRGMGKQAVLTYLQDQVPLDTGKAGKKAGKAEPHIGALVVVCGEGMKLKCQNSSPLSTGPGDLPFISEPSAPQFLPYMVLTRKLTECTDARTTDATKQVMDEIKGWSSDLTLQQKRLVLFYAVYKVFFASCMSSEFAKELAYESELQTLMQLDSKQQRVLHFLLDRAVLKDRNKGEELDLIDSLMRGSKDGWSEIIMTALCVASSDPDTLIGSYFYNINAQRKNFIPGDKTGGDVSHGGGYKIDCVTQLDLNGDLTAYARGQQVLSAGACYLLWCITFGGWSLQLALFRQDSWDTCDSWLVSATIKQRAHAYQRALTDYQHLATQFAERSIAYHLHMGAHTGITIDEAQATFALLLSRFADGGGIDKKNDVLRRVANKTRDEALQAEREVQNLWDLACSKSGAKKKNSEPQQEGKDCHTNADLSRFTGQKPRNLSRSEEVYSELERMPAQELPKLLAMTRHHKDKLSLLAPLICEVYSFSMRVHRMLSYILPAMSTGDTGEEVRTPLVSVLGLFRQHTPPSQYRMASEQLHSIKTKWNQFRDKVGPIDFECEEGGINIEMSETEEQIGAAGLPDTLDFWITMPTDGDGEHKNLIKAALLSLTDKVCVRLCRCLVISLFCVYFYSFCFFSCSSHPISLPPLSLQYNECQSILQEYTGVQIGDVDPGNLNPSKPDLMLREHKGLAEVCRSHVDEHGKVCGFFVFFLCWGS